jgi:hypothetical protein
VAELVSQPTSIQSIYTWFREDKLYVNRRYQRKLVWNLLEKQKLIESILNKYPIPAILVAEREDEAGTYEIIDGLQRLHAIVSFIETAFPTLEDSYFNLELFPTAKSKSESGIFKGNTSTNTLTQNDTSKILDYTLALSVMRNATEAQVNDVFDRINTYGHRLSDQERRQAGVQNDFSDLVRQISCELRGDVSDDILTLGEMPSISIDLPMSNHGYEVRAEEVFWVQQGILRSTDLRDSMDEQCVADILVCIVGGEPIPRTKDALDATYMEGSDECVQILNALDIYGSKKIAEEFKYCIDEIKTICATDGGTKLREIIFQKRSTNPFPAVFATLFIAMHELFVQENKIVADHQGVRSAINNLVARIESSRRGGSSTERRKNIDTVKGVITPHFIETTGQGHIYGVHSTIDIESTIRRSQIELAHYELKQGLVSLSDDRRTDKNMIDKVIRTICAMANNGIDKEGKILIGVTDNDSDAKRVKLLDKIEPKKIGKRFVVGISREANVLKISLEQYVSIWKNGIKNSDLSVHLRDSVLSNVDYHDFYGLGVIIFTIPPQPEMSYVGEDTYFRSNDSTEQAQTAREIASIARRFS